MHSQQKIARVQVLNSFMKKCSLVEFKNAMSQFILDEPYSNWHDFENRLLTFKNANERNYYLSMKAFSRSIHVKNFLDPKLIFQLSEQFGIRKPTMFSNVVLHITGENFSRYSGVSPHQDFSSQGGSLNSIVAWIPIGGVQQENGGLYIRDIGDQKKLLPCLPTDQVAEIDPRHLDKFPEYYYAPSECDILVFDQFVPHYSKSTTNLRVSLSLRIEDATCSDWLKRDLYFAHSIVINRQKVGFEGK